MYLLHVYMHNPVHTPFKQNGKESESSLFYQLASLLLRLLPVHFSGHRRRTNLRKTGGPEISGIQEGKGKSSPLLLARHSQRAQANLDHGHPAGENLVGEFQLRPDKHHRQPADRRAGSEVQVRRKSAGDLCFGVPGGAWVLDGDEPGFH
ncbi:unnamed protein product [Cuscuta epithymum]|uniref:Uncharacterized protein n=1 Tax=Cuscuta epithymum TaxID=186058 RepID=A0AAV0FH14_9ASTE|nr:unnamed protein product [Cuscuta epithymum]